MAPSRRVRVWDVPVRLGHGLMVGAVALCWWSAETGRLEWHRRSGYTLLGVVIFRVYWGFFGSSTARFSAFVRGPRTVLAYLTGSWPATPGHNPLGALSVLALLVAMMVQITLGLFAVDLDSIESGPLSLYVSFETGRVAAAWHETVFNILKGLIVLHVGVIAYYLVVRRENLVAAMCHGAREYPAECPLLRHASLPRFIVGVTLSAALTWAVVRAFQFSG